MVVANSSLGSPSMRLACWVFCGQKMGVARATYGDVMTVTLFVLSIIVCASLAALLLFHCNLIRLNRTTMERQ